ncbi:MAG TPA: YetF domain-containing protein, partial [Thermoanaerobaculia bacterium]
EDSSVAGGFIGAFTLMLVNYLVIRFLFRHRRLDQILEGKPTVLIREGRICKDQLAKEMITVHELQAVCRRQGFDGIHEVEDCVLEPGGAFVMRRKVPSDDEQKHAELVESLNAIRDQIRRLEERVA